MRLLTLDLMAYGKFTGHRIDFPEGKGVHVIYGSNEAGKSTCVRALRNLLYGIPLNTLDDFIHEGKQLRVGGTLLGSNGKKLSVVRRKGLKATLLGPDERPMAEEELQAFLGGIDRETFVRVFGLNRDELVSGGRVIMEGKGGVGESLFAAGLGGADLKKVLDTLDSEAGDLFKPTGTLPKLNAEAKAYRDLKNQVRNLVLLPKDWEELEGTVSTLEERSRTLKDRMARLSAAEDRLKRLHDALPLMAELREARKKRDDLGEVKIIRRGFSLERNQTQLEKKQALLDEKTANLRIEEIDRVLEKLTIPEALLAQEKTVQGLVEELGGIEKARKDLPRIEGQGLEARQDAKAILGELRPDLDLASAGLLRLTVKEVERIRRLVEVHGQVTIRRQNSADKVREYARKLNTAQKSLTECPEPGEPTDLERTIALVRRKGDLERAFQDTLFEARNYREDTQAALKRLQLWSGTQEDLESLPLPPEGTVERFEKLIDTLDDALRKARGALAENAEKMAEVEGHLRTLKLAGEPPTEAELMTARESRDQGWALVRCAWLDGKRNEAAETAFGLSVPLDQAFEKSVLTADALADRMRREAEKVAQKTAFLTERTWLEERAQALSREMEHLGEKRKGLEKDWASRWSSAGFIPLSPREMRGWMNDWKDLARRVAEGRKLEGRARKMSAEIQESRKVLLTGLAALKKSISPGGASLEAVLLKAEELVLAIKDLGVKRDGLDRAIEEARSGKSQAEEEEKKQETALLGWEKEWQAVITGLCVDLPVSAANLFLDKCQTLSRKLAEAQKDQNRIEGMKRDIEIFEGKVWDFVALQALDLMGGKVDQTVRDLSDRVARAKTDAASQANLSAERASRVKDVNTARETIRMKSDLLDSLQREAGCREEREFPEAERRSEAACSLDDRIMELNKQIVLLAAGQKKEVFFGEVQEEDPEQVLQELAKVKAELDETQDALGRVRENLGAFGERLRAMDGRSDAARAAQEAQERLGSLRENTRRYLSLRLAAKILRTEVEKYREKSQGPVLKRAGELFASLTQGFFTGLEPDYSAGDQPILVGVRENKEKVALTGMSDGTQDQLYLALRLASLEHFMAGGMALPLLVDDALVNFDDHRARAALHLIAGLVKTTQVIFFTHHRHMVQLARETIDDEILHVRELVERT
jgi:uncharacterized protein YhaN